MNSNNDILIKVTELQTKLQTKLQSTTKGKILDEITRRIGSLSKPSKMPGYSWSISAHACPTGSILAKVPGTPCSFCYAQKGRYNFPVVANAHDTRLELWNSDVDWATLMSIRLLLLRQEHFRWFDSGDIQNAMMIDDINTVAKNTDPWIQHWLPTQERSIVKKYGAVAPNLNIRISSTKINEQQRVSSELTSSFVTDKDPINVYVCPSSEQNGKCLDCRACWDKTVKTVAYKKH